MTTAGVVAAGGPWSWEEPHATVLPRGDLAWRPRPFAFEAGGAVRYVDFEHGDDRNDGTRRETPFQHHPWDARATAQAAACRGIHTYVFKRGVVYRGALTVRDEGAPGDPVRLTSDPDWGTGDAVLCGSRLVRGWTRGAERPDIPEPGTVWRAELDFAPRCVWITGGDGAVTRIPLARTPNWTVTDPDDVKSGWWHWNYPTGRPFDVFTKGPRGGKLHLGVDTEHLTRPASYYRDAILWTEHGWVMGAPYPVRVAVVDEARHGLGFEGRWGDADSYKIVKFNRYFLEDKPEYLDDPAGEFWFDRRGRGGRLYLRPPDGADPERVHVEAAAEPTLIDATRVRHVEIAGLTFRFTNVPWNLDGVPYRDGDDLDPACIRVHGSTDGLRVANCRFEHVNTAVLARAGARGEDADGVVIEDNDVAETDRGGFHVLDGSAWGEVEEKGGRLGDVRIMRNRLREIGKRPTRFNLGFAVDVMNARTVEVAGNVLDRLYGGGINVSGAKRDRSAADRPFARLLIHHNKVTQPLLSGDDFGGIETWQGGPAYVYDNVSGDPGGYRNFGLLEKDRPAWARFGHAYYLDGAFKNYHFNNVAWGKSADPFSRLGAAAAFQEIHSYQNTFFNNTVFNFVKGTRRQAPKAGRDKFLGNVWQGIGEWLFWHAEPAGSPAEGNARDAGPQQEAFDYATDAYARNVWFGVAGQFGVFEPSGRWCSSATAFRDALEARRCLASGVGEAAARPPLRDPEHGDFRPAPGSAAAGRGVKVFVPWALSGVVAEWNFYHAGGDPATIPDEHWYLTPYHTRREEYYTRPMFPLHAVHVGASDYVTGPLEDWIAGALSLNGRDQYAVARDADLTRPFAYKEGTEPRTAAGEALKSPQIHHSNVLLEAVFRAEPGGRGGTLVRKMDAAGYALKLTPEGVAEFSVAGPGGAGTVTGRAPLADGAWHHLLAEADRAAGTLALYADGKPDAAGAGIGPAVSLANAADLYVGGTPRGDCLAGALDFVRIALGTLRDASTTSEELYAWEFDGPFLRDFTGRTPPAGRRDAGAISGGP